jgi:hypothetical protein
VQVQEAVMSPATPWYATPIVLGGGLFLVFLFNRVVSRAAEEAGLGTSTRQRVTWVTTAVLAGWFVLSLIFSLMPASPEAAARPIPISFPLFMGGSLLLGLGALRIPAWRRTVAAIPLWTLVGAQFYRLIGVLFLVLYSVGTLPGYFALPAGWGDAAVGIAAILLGYALFRDVPGARALSVAFNLIGLSDLIVAVGTGTGLLVPLLLGGPQPAPTTPMTVFPLYLIPTFAVPIAVLLHLYSLRAVLRESGSKEIGERRRVEGLAA